MRFNPKNRTAPVASGPGIQIDPMLLQDETGGLHHIWLEKENADESPRIRYGVGVWKD